MKDFTKKSISFFLAAMLTVTALPAAAAEDDAPSAQPEACVESAPSADPREEEVSCPEDDTVIGDITEALFSEPDGSDPEPESYDETVAVIFEPNGADECPSPQLVLPGEPFVLTDEIPVREGYVFKGWAANKTDLKNGKVSYRPGRTMTLNGDKKLYAVWKAATYTVHYHANNENEPGKSYTAVLTWGKSATIRSSGFSLPGCSLKGWSYAPSEPAIEWSADLSAGEKLSADGVKELIRCFGHVPDIDLYAVWSPVQYKISYKSGQSAALKAADNPNPGFYYSFEGLLLSEPDSPGYDFAGFFTDSKYTKPLTEIIPGSTGSRTVYLRFTPHTYTVVPDPGEGTAVKTAASLKGTVGKTLTLPSCTFKAPEGMRFSHWEYTGADGQPVQAKAGAKVKNLSLEQDAVVTLTAIYIPVTYTVTYHPNGGSFADGKKTLKQSADYGAELPAADETALNERTGYSFLGWNTKADSSGTGVTDTILNLSSKHGANVNLYASWGYDIILDGNGGKLPGGDTSIELRLIYNQAVKPEDFGFSMSGMRFRGWSTSAANASSGKVLTSLKNLRPGTVLYASWKKIPVGVSESFLSKCSSSYKSGKYYEALTEVSLGTDRIENILAVAASQVGYHESNKSSQLSGEVQKGTGNYTEYGRYVSCNGEPWCNFFVMWCIDAAGTPDSVYPKGTNPTYEFDKLKSRGLYFTYSGQKLKRGDMVYTGSHIYFVESVDANGTIHGIDGNSTDGVNRTTYHKTSEIKGIIRLKK